MLLPELITLLCALSKEASEFSSETTENAAPPLPNFVRDERYRNHIRKEEEIIFLFCLGDLLSSVKKSLCLSFLQLS